VGGNIFVVDRSVLESKENLELCDMMLSKRKSLSKMASVLGWDFLILYTLSTLGMPVLTVKAIEKRFGKAIKTKAKAIFGPPSLTVDIDNMERYQYFLDRI